MSDPATAFEKLIGRQPTDEDRQRLYRTGDALGLRSNDALWLILIALEHYLRLYEAVPERIGKTTQKTLTEFKATADSQAQLALAEAQQALTEAVADNAAKIARDTAGKELFRWVTYALMVAAIFSVTAFVASSHIRESGYRDGYAAGLNAGIAEARDEKAAASWANTPEGELAYGLAKGGSLTALATCSEPGWQWRLFESRMACIPYPDPVSKNPQGWWMAPGIQIPARPAEPAGN